MSTAFRVTVGVVVTLGLLACAAAWYLYTDDPYAALPNEADLQQTASTDIPSTDVPAQMAASAPPGPPNIRVQDSAFVAPDGRTMYLRGINLSGSSKVPYDPYLPTHVREDFFAGDSVSFVGRPFPLDEAERHFARLKAWGFHFARLIVTWEAIEHAGPGQYDTAYLDYIEQIVRLAGEHGINVFIDPHQDVFSRFSGGDGAPMWVFEKVGLDVRTFQETGVALVHNLHDGPYPRMGWVTNYDKMASATMFTLFFGGNTFAPKTTVEGEPVQDYLQRHYIEAIRQVALRLKDHPNVIGFDTHNEPSPGYIGMQSLTSTGLFQTGPMPTHFQGMLLASGIPQEVGVYEFSLWGPEEAAREVLNPDSVSAWIGGREGIWKQHGVWDFSQTGEPLVLKPRYFSERNGGLVDFAEDYLKPFIQRYDAAIRSVDADWYTFVEPAMMEAPPTFSDSTAADSTLADSLAADSSAAQYVYAPHWYDGATLITKNYSPVLGVDVMRGELLIGKTAIRQSFESQLARLKEEGRTHVTGGPTIIGEVGIPFDLNEGEAFETGDFSAQSAALNRTLHAVEANLLGYTLWNYTPDNTNEHGDQWNGEDLSIFSRSQQREPSNINSGGRALDAVIRPYPYKIAGALTQYQFNPETSTLLVRYTHDASIGAPTEVFLPAYHYDDGFTVQTKGGTLAWNEAHDLLRFTPSEEGDTEQVIVVRPSTP